MTLIIAFKCRDGIVFVADTKITEIDTGIVSYDSKILSPLADTPCIVGSSGYVNLYKEFNRKIPETVASKIAQIRIQNIQELIKTGLSRDQAIDFLQSKEQCISTTLKIAKENAEQCKNFFSNIKDIDLPYRYTEENFIDDCKSLIKQIEDQSVYTESLEVLIGIRRPTDKMLHLHHIDSYGIEEEISDYFAIGAGYPFVETIFGRLYDYDKEWPALATDAVRTILYSKIVAKENSVGYSQDFPPEVVIVYNDGNYGKIIFENEGKVINEIEKEMEIFINHIKQNKITVLEPKK